MYRRIRALLLRPDPWPLLPLCIVLAVFQWKYAGYVKDDAYISLRYARNLAMGEGLVFNPGDRLEGYTNFLWILLATPAFWLEPLLGLDPLDWTKALGCLFGQIGVFVCWRFARFFGGDRAGAAGLLAPALWASSASVILWSMSGLEPTMMGCLAGGGTLLAMRVFERRSDGPEASRTAVSSALLLAAAALCRPDAHAILLGAGAFALFDWLRRGLRRPDPWLLWAAVIIGILAPYHAWRVAYFGDLLPNTFYVKAAAGPEVMKEGLGYVKELLLFGATPLALALALLSPLARERRLCKLWGWALLLGFLFYLVRIGRDEMKWYRLLLPVLPILLALAADGLRLLCEGAARLASRVVAGPLLPAVFSTFLALVLALGGMPVGLAYAREQAAWHSNYRDWSERSFQAMGRYVQARSEPGTTVVFQDMGGAPYASPRIRWVDTIGILDRTVARELAKNHVNPFLRDARAREPGGRAALREMDARLRDYFFEQEPAWIAFVAYISEGQRGDFARKVRKVGDDPEELEALFRPRIRGTSHAHGLVADSRFEDFVFEQFWKRNNGYWVVLYRHKGHDPRPRAQAGG
jgi:hypothetical protein